MRVTMDGESRPSLTLMQHDPRALGKFISAQRRLRGWSLSELARRAEVGKATLSRWERGVAEPAIPVLDSVLDSLAVGQEDREAAYAMVGAPRGLRALRASEEQSREELAELGLGTLTLGDLLRALRLRSRKRGMDLAAELGVTPGTISHWERGERTPDPESLHRFAQAVGASAPEQRMLAGAKLALGQVVPKHDDLLERLLPINGRILAIRHDGLELELILLAAEAWRLAKTDPRGLSLLKSILSQRSLVLSEGGRAQEAIAVALQVHDIPAPPHPADRRFYPPAAVIAWAKSYGAKGRPSERDYRYALQSVASAPDAAARKEILIQAFNFPARWGDLAELHRLRDWALREHEALKADFRPLDVEWLLADAYHQMGLHHEALAALPLSVPFPLSQVHTDTLMASTHEAIGDHRSATAYAQRVRSAVVVTGFAGPEEKKLLARLEQEA